MIYTTLDDFIGTTKKPWPVKITADIYNYNQVNHIDSEYVWLQNYYIKLRDGFPLGWIPEKNVRDNPHLFYECFFYSKKPIRPAMILVPTNSKLREINHIKSGNIAAYDHIHHTIFFLGNDSDESFQKYEEHKKLIPRAQLITDQSEKELEHRICRYAISKYVWLVDIDIRLNPTFDWNFEPNENEDIIYNFKKAKLYPYSYFTPYQKPNCKIVEIDSMAGR